MGWTAKLIGLNGQNLVVLLTVETEPFVVPTGILTGVNKLYRVVALLSIISAEARKSVFGLNASSGSPFGLWLIGLWYFPFRMTTGRLS